MTKVIYVKNGTWWIFPGSVTQAKKLPHTAKHQKFTGELGPLTLAAQRRPHNFFDLDGREQWAIDKSLGILDWDGNPSA